MDLFFCLRADAPEFFSDRDPLHPKIQEIFTMVDLLPLPKLTPEGYKCFVYRLAFPYADPEKFHFNDYVKTFFLVGDSRIRSEKQFPTGEVIIFDMDGFTFRHLTKVVLTSLRKYMQYAQEAHPVRLKQVHVINVSPLLDKAMSLAKPLIKSEVAQMIHFHLPGSSTLQEFVPIEIMPNEYGGQAGSIKDIKETWKKTAENNREWFLSDPWIADNSKRTDRKNMPGIMDGSFRSLIID
ncbi:hypothetical protein AAG570_006572 [Ranatra chinensis]|uniref:CRAL-TRIO domain-containing protein n=1 Tax=Ranatra chinensis TaxID=642074 RepID=A0ABD0YUD8_9HEMI